MNSFYNNGLSQSQGGGGGGEPSNPSSSAEIVRQMPGLLYANSPAMRAAAELLSPQRTSFTIPAPPVDSSRRSSSSDASFIPLGAINGGGEDGGSRSNGATPTLFSPGSNFNYSSLDNSSSRSLGGGGTGAASPSTVGPAPPCEICNDKSTGKHYGVFSCEGCKGFFKRTVRQKLTYHCKDGGSCVIDKNLRNRCQACRFKKCINRGMRSEAVQEERRRPGQSSNLEDANFTNSYRTLIDKLISAEKELERELANELNPDSLIKRSPSTPSWSHLEGAENRAPLDFNQDLPDMSEESLNFKVQRHMKRTVEWAFKIPFFIDLHETDKVTLLASAFSQLFIITEIYQKKHADSCSGGNLNRESADIDKIKRLTEELVAQMSSLDIDKAEVGCLKAVILFNPEADGLQSNVKPEIERRRDMVFLALQEYVEAKHPSDLSRGNKILLRLPCLRTVGHRCVEELEVFKAVFSQASTLTDMFYTHVRRSAPAYAHPSAYSSSSSLMETDNTASNSGDDEPSTFLSPGSGGGGGGGGFGHPGGAAETYLAEDSR